MCNNQGLIIGKNEIPIEPAMLRHLDQFGFKADFAMQCLNKNKHNQVTTTYYLLLNRYQKEGKMPSGFKVESTPQKNSSVSIPSEQQSGHGNHRHSPSESPAKKRRPSLTGKPEHQESGGLHMKEDIDFSNLQVDSTHMDQIGSGISPQKQRTQTYNTQQKKQRNQEMTRAERDRAKA